MIIGQVPKHISEPIRATLLNNPYFPWYLCTCTTEYNSDYTDSLVDEYSGEESQFMHTVVNNSGNLVSQIAYETCVNDMLGYISKNYDIPEYQKLRRIKINLLPKTHNKYKYHTPHVDCTSPHWTLIYYVNDSDGPTYLFNEKYNGLKQKLSINQSIEPEEGKFILFDGLYYHASSSPINHDWRSVINVNFLVGYESFTKGLTDS